MTVIAVATVAAIRAAAALGPGLGQPGPGTRTSRCCPVIPNGQSRLLTVQLGYMFVRPSSVSVPYGTKGAGSAPWAADVAVWQPQGHGKLWQAPLR